MSLSFDDLDKYKTSKVCDKKLNDNEWHTISLVCKENQPVQVKVDGESFKVETGERKPILIDSITFGSAEDVNGVNNF